MKLYAKSERTISTGTLLSTFRTAGYKTTNVGVWCRWKEYGGCKVQVKMTVYEVKANVPMACFTAYLISDTLGRVAAPMVENKQEIMDWLKEKGYKPERQWYIEDYGMSEETWDAWTEE